MSRANVSAMIFYCLPLNNLDMDCITRANNLRNEKLLTTAEHFGHGLHNMRKYLSGEMLLATAEHLGH